MKKNFLDGLLGFFFPSVALKRMESRARAEVIGEAVRAFEGATRGRRGDNWNAHNESDPNTSIMQSLPVLRERSRALYKNNPYARKAIKTICLNVIGKGIRPAIMDKSKTRAEIVKKEWKEWAKKKNCDFNGRNNFYTLQMQAMKAVAMSGECLVIRRRDSSGRLPFKIQLLDGQHLDSSKSSIDYKDKENYTLQGVEYDPQGRRVAYWIYDRPPSNNNSLSIESRRIPASDVLHIFEEERPGQVRGVPFLTASMLRLRDFDDYEDAQLMRQKIAACFSVFVTQAPTVLGEPTTSELAELERVEPGIIERLAPGETVSFASPPPAEGYADYTRKVAQGISAGVGVSYEAMTGDLTGVNFSSGRMGWLESRKQTEDWQAHMFIPLFCEGVWEWFNEGLNATGKLNGEAKCEWTPPGYYMIDPAKEVKGTTAQMSAGLISWSEAVRAQGHDPDTLLQEIREDQEKIEEAGLKLDWMPEEEALQGEGGE